MMVHSLAKTPPLWVAALSLTASGCVLGVDDAYSVDDPFDAVVLRLGTGNVDIEGTSLDSARVDVELGGLGATDYGYRVRDRVLYLDYDCGDVDLCGGDLQVRLPRWVDVDIDMGAGDLNVQGMSGAVVARLGSGEIDAGGLTGELGDFATGAGSASVRYRGTPDIVGVAVATGEIDIEVPRGAYDLDLSADAGSVKTRGVNHDPAASSKIVALTSVGSITVTGI